MSKTESTNRLGNTNSNPYEMGSDVIIGDFIGHHSMIRNILPPWVNIFDTFAP